MTLIHVVSLWQAYEHVMDFVSHTLKTQGVRGIFAVGMRVS